MLKTFKKLSILDIVNLIMLVCITVIYIITFNKTPWRLSLFIIYFFMFLYLFVSIWLRSRNISNNVKTLFLFVHPVIFLFALFETFFMLLPYFNTSVYDSLLENIDVAILGVSPTLWIEQFSTPLLTDIMYLFYFFYFPMPLIILGWMLYKGKHKDIEKSMFSLLLCYYGAYLIYFFVPAQGPRFFLHESYSLVLNGYFLAAPIHAVIDALEPNKLDAFPSLHTAILTVTMIITFKNNRKIFIWFIIAAIGIIISLIYCRYHYFIDIVAGLIWAILITILAEKMYTYYSAFFTDHFGKRY